MVVVYLDAASSHRSYRRGSAIEFDLCAWSWVNAFVAKASQRNKPHFCRVACSEPFVRRQFDCRLFSNVGSYQGMFLSLWLPAVSKSYETSTIGLILSFELGILRDRVICCVYRFYALLYL